jgi:hypothetical protein
VKQAMEANPQTARSRPRRAVNRLSFNQLAFFIDGNFSDGMKRNA